VSVYGALGPAKLLLGIKAADRAGLEYRGKNRESIKIRPVTVQKMTGELVVREYPGICYKARIQDSVFH